jgi:hypothetical protein
MRLFFMQLVLYAAVLYAAYFAAMLCALCCSAANVCLLYAFIAIGVIFNACCYAAVDWD